MADLDAIRAKLAVRAEPCSEGCPGWGVFARYGSSRHPDGSLGIQRCDDCWAGHPNRSALYDDEAELLPEAQAALAADLRKMHDEDHGAAYGLFAEWCPHCLDKLSWLKKGSRAA